MRKQIEGPINSRGVVEMEEKNRRMAEIIRAKNSQRLTLTPEEEAFYQQQQEENRRDDNPYRSRRP